MTAPILTQERLKEFLHYNPDTGIFTWRVSPRPGIRVGSTAGRTDSGGYRQIGIEYTVYSAQRLAWLYTHGVLPPNETDHINGCRSDNRIINLRLVTKSQNQQNAKVRKDNLSGQRGVAWLPSLGKWSAKLQVSGVRIDLGRFKEKNDAIAAYQSAAKKYHPYRPEAK